MSPASNQPLKPKAEHKPGSKTARQSSPTAAKTESSRTSPADHQSREITVTIPADKIFSTAAGLMMTPVSIARRVLPAKGGVPLYAGLGALAVVGLIEWPVAAAAGVGYALARRWTPQQTKQEPAVERTDTASG